MGILDLGFSTVFYDSNVDDPEYLQGRLGTLDSAELPVISAREPGVTPTSSLRYPPYDITYTRFFRSESPAPDHSVSHSRLVPFVRLRSASRRSQPARPLLASYQGPST